MRVHLAHPPAAVELAYLRSLLDPGITLTLGPALPAPPDYETLVAGRPSRAELAGPHLKRLIIPWAGLPDATAALLRAFPQVAVYNLHHNARSAAEMALALLLAAAKFIVPMDRALRAHDWTPRYQPNPAVLLHGSTALILGYGAIGQLLAPLCQGLGMRVRATRRTLVAPERDAAGAEVYPASALHALLPQANVLFLCLPLTPETEGVIGAAELALLPPRAILVNVGRGPLVDEAALYAALREGQLHAAGLDVWYSYPAGRDEGYGENAARVIAPPSAYPFHELDNVVLSPHRAGGLGTADTERFRMEGLAALLNAAARGDPLPNQVNLEAGY